MVAVEILLEPEGVKIPTGLENVEDFRRWARSDAFPETGRIDWIQGEMVVDMSPEDLNTHGSPKTAIAHGVVDLVEEKDLGVVYIDRARVSVPDANLSVEPDLVVVFFSSVESGRVKLVPRASGTKGRYVEIEGPPEIVVECVSDSSVAKDTKRLLEAYHRAGVREYWLVDARGPEPVLALHRHAKDDWETVVAGADGFRRSALLGVSVRLDRLPERAGLVRYKLRTS